MCSFQDISHSGILPWIFPNIFNTFFFSREFFQFFQTPIFIPVNSCVRVNIAIIPEHRGVDERGSRSYLRRIAYGWMVHVACLCKSIQNTCTSALLQVFGILELPQIRKIVKVWPILKETCNIQKKLAAKNTYGDSMQRNTKCTRYKKKADTVQNDSILSRDKYDKHSSCSCACWNYIKLSSVCCSTSMNIRKVPSSQLLAMFEVTDTSWWVE